VHDGPLGREWDRARESGAAARATAWGPWRSRQRAGGEAGFDLEFVTVTGARIQQVTKREIRVVDAPAAR